jgi:hypothetical protein
MMPNIKRFVMRVGNDGNPENRDFRLDLNRELRSTGLLSQFGARLMQMKAKLNTSIRVICFHLPAL